MTRCYSDALFTHDGNPGSTWDDYPVMRWLNQLALGVVPGLLMLWAIVHLAAKPDDQGLSCSASVFPLLAIATAADNSTFHRYGFDHNLPADVAPRFRLPDPDRRDTKPKHVLTVTKRVSALPVKFDAPRQSWQHLSASVRSMIDTGLKASATAWQRIVLHGSSTQAGNAKLLDRYHRQLHGGSAPLPYHFIIGNGKQSTDGQIEACQSWQTGHVGSDTADPGHSGSINICFIGDFNTQPPSNAQLEALDELLDYLAIKIGHLPASTHHLATGSDSSCLGSQFPIEAVLSALAAPEPH